MNVENILEELVKFNTVKDQENTAILNYIEKLLKNKNFKTEYKSKCLIMSLNNKISRLGFLGHTDTETAGEGWNTNPFQLVRENDKLIGLGTCDMKGGIAAILQAILETDWDKLKYGIKIYLTYDEEINFSGIKELIKFEKFPNYMIIGEPTNNEVMNSSKGLLELQLIFEGISAHSSLLNQGENAIEKCFNFLNEFKMFYYKIENEKNDNFEIPYTTMNIGKITGGNSINIVPNKCEIWIDFRIINNSHMMLILNKIDELIKKYDGNYKILNQIDSFVSKDKKIYSTNFITEASFIKSKYKYIMGVGPINPHKTNEYITKTSLEKLVEQYKEKIQKICK